MNLAQYDIIKMNLAQYDINKKYLISKLLSSNKIQYGRLYKTKNILAFILYK